MEAVNRKPFQGISNIVRFNRHFFIAGLAWIILLLYLANVFTEYNFWLYLLLLLSIAGIAIPMLISACVYDLSGLYEMNWINLSVKSRDVIVNIHAGFDETSSVLHSKYPETELQVFDFYDPKKHTEISIKRARSLTIPYPGTTQITTANLPLQDNSVDYIFLIFSAHEIRDREERSVFFTLLKKTLKPNGKIIILEHLRDLENVLAYNIGALHFHSRLTWLETFRSAELSIISERSVTPFLTLFTLEKNGTIS